jgi:vacuolar-type H+-ATPase subunit I/STV1
MDKASIKEELRAAKAMSKASADEKEIRKTAIENAKKKLTALSAVKKNFRGVTEITQPDFAELDGLYDREDEINAEMKSLYLELSASKEFKDSVKKAEIQQKIASLKGEKKALQKKIKDEMNRHAYFNRAAKPYLDAEKLVKQADNYTHLGDIEAEYEAAKSRVGAMVQE